MDQVIAGVLLASPIVAIVCVRAHADRKSRERIDARLKAIAQPSTGTTRALDGIVYRRLTKGARLGALARRILLTPGSHVE